MLLPPFAPQMSITACHARCLNNELVELSRAALIDNSHSSPEIPTTDQRIADADGASLLFRLRRALLSKAGRQLSPLAACRAVLRGNHPSQKIRDFFERLPAQDKHYWIATYYALLMPQEKRRRLAAYFTPPDLAKYAIDKLIQLGIQPGASRILDPSSGGAAFLVPLAQAIAQDARKRQLEPRTTLNRIQKTIAGIEIDKSLVGLSQLLLADVLSKELTRTGRKLHISITNGNALETAEPAPSYDAVIGNPPYGRIFRPTQRLLSQYSRVISNGYVNKYALFVQRAIAWTRPGGVICLILPMSFLGGPHFAALRKYILEQTIVFSLDPIEERRDLFMDALCDVCVFTLRKKSPKLSPVVPTSSHVRAKGPSQLIGVLELPDSPNERIWALPDNRGKASFFDEKSSSLHEYGYLVRAGYFVWNREKDRYREGQFPRKNEVPLYWARNIRPNRVAEPLVKEPSLQRPFGFVRPETATSVVITSDALLIQRTSNRRQKRRLIAGLVLQRTVLGGAGFLSENHTVAVVPRPGSDPSVPLRMLCRLLNSAAVDARFRRISGTVSVSVAALRTLPLPPPSRVVEAFNEISCDDEAAEQAYGFAEAPDVSDPNAS